MSGIYQLNQATGSVTLPSSGNTFIGTSTNSELYSIDSSGTVTVYGTGSGGGGGGTGSIDTGSFATTGSNTFVGDQILSGSLLVSESNSVFAKDFRNPGTSPISFGDNVEIDGVVTITDNIICQGAYISGSEITNISIGGSITSSGDISSSGTVIAKGVNVQTTDTSSSFDIGTEQIIPVLGMINASSSAIINQSYPSGRIGRTTEIIGDVNMDIGPASYPIDGHHVFYHSGSRELWKASGEWDLETLGFPRTVGNQIQYGDGNLAGTGGTFNDYRLIVGENVSDVWGGAYLMGRQSGSTYGANTQYAGFFASGSLGLPGTPQGHDKAFTIYAGYQTGNALNIYNVNDPEDITSGSGSDPVFSVSSSGATIIKGLPTTEPIGPDAITGSLWISGSSAQFPNSGYLMVFNP